MVYLTLTLTLGGIITHPFIRACLHGGGGPQIGEVTWGWPGHPTYHVNMIKLKMRDYMDRWVTPPKWVTSPTWGPQPPCKQALSCKLHNKQSGKVPLPVL